jgi:hypothetical protein
MPLDASTRVLLRQLAWRRSPPGRQRSTAGLAVALLLHVLFVLLIWHEMRPIVAPAIVHLQLHDVLQVRLIGRVPAVAVRPPPPEPAQAPSSPPALPRHEPPARNAMTLQLPTSAPTSTLLLYGKQGQPLLPAPATSSTEPGYVQHLPSGDTRIMHDTDPIKYKATRFEQYFPPPDESLGGAAVRHVVQAVVHTTAVDLPHGVHLRCMTILGIPIPDCINPAPPPSPKDADERLNMAPARPLAADPHPPQPPGVAACIAIYRAGRPLPWGCPVDTPNRAVDDELRQRASGDRDRS